MTQILAEQMRSLSRRLQQIHEAPAPTDSASQVHLKGNLNAKKLAELLDGQELLGVEDVNKFTQAINMVKQGNIDSLSNLHRKELAMAFIALLQADKKVTQQIMDVLRTVSADKPQG
jgi:gamma-glutamylcysteine synthetase